MTRTPAPGSPIRPRDAGRVQGVWARGLTPPRLAVLLVISAVVAARPALWNVSADNAGRALMWHVQVTARHFVFGLPMLVLLAWAEDVASRSSRRRAALAVGVAALAGATLFSVGLAGLKHFVGEPLVEAWIATFFLRALVLGALLGAVLVVSERARRASQRAHRVRLSKLELERRITESRLRLLQAQIEPHFLFNCLALIRRQYRRAPDRGRRLIGYLRDYLREASAHARRRETRLDEEFALARAFLGIFGERMGSRLRVSIDLPASVAPALVPPLMIGTLVENAVKHGIDPRATGGSIHLDARREGGQVEVRVCDDGVGFRANSGAGVGLSNTRARLEALYGGAAALDVTSRAEGGTCAVLTVPYRIMEGDQ